MTRSARDLLDSVRRDLEPDADANRVVALIATGQAPRTVLAALAAEQHHIIPSDQRSFLTLAARSDAPAAREFSTSLAQGETLALSHLRSLAVACGMDQAPWDGYQALAAVQAGLDERVSTERALRYGRLLQSYELMFWSTLEPR